MADGYYDGGVWVDGDERPCVYVATDHNDDEARTFYEIPDALARRVWGSWEPTDVLADGRVFCQALADLIPDEEPACENESRGERVGDLATRLYCAWVEYERETNNLIEPQWQFLRDDIQAVFLRAAAELLPRRDA